jgi:hypothetical protein
MERLPTFTIDRGKPYARSFTVADSSGPIDFTGFSATARVYDSNTLEEIIASEPTLSNLGVVTTTFPDTTLFPAGQSLRPTYQYFCDIMIYEPDGTLSRFMRANVKVTR